jgi:MFS family permease
MDRTRLALPLIVLAETLGTSLWFCGTAAVPELTTLWQLDAAGQASLLTVVQWGFIAGTLLLALTGLADAFPASRVFAVACLLGAAANLGFAWVSPTLTHALVWRFVTGLALAGIYPLGMKLVVTWMPGHSGFALGWLVGSVSLGTSLPFLLRALGGNQHWQWLTSIASVLTLLAAGLVHWLGDGLAARPLGQRFHFTLAISAFRDHRFRASALGYFGHMWELYAFWSMVPWLVKLLSNNGQEQAWWAFTVIAIGAVGNVIGGQLSHKWGSARVAVIMLASSGLCCLICPWLGSTPVWLTGIVLLTWGFTAPADSPQFSALSARACPPQAVGSALALQNSIGFMITVISIHLTAEVQPTLGLHLGWLWLLGPVLGLLAMRGIMRNHIPTVT